MDLAELRARLDEIDSSMVELFEKRMDICRQVAEDKIKTGKRILDKERERQKIQTVSSLICSLSVSVYALPIFQRRRYLPPILSAQIVPLTFLTSLPRILRARCL